MVNLALSAPPSVYPVMLSWLSASEALTVPTAVLFSATEKDVPLENVGALLETSAVAVKVTLSVVSACVTEAVTVFAPPVEPSVSVVCARPVEPVETVVALRVPPPAVTANVTGTSANTAAGFAPSFTSTTKGFVKVALAWLVCESPEIFVSVAGVREVYVTLALFRLAMARSIAGMCV